VAQNRPRSAGFHIHELPPCVVEIHRLPFRRRTTPEFIEEVLKEDDLMLRRLRLQPLGRQQIDEEVWRATLSRS
jgi:hypothetical protein